MARGKKREVADHPQAVTPAAVEQVPATKVEIPKGSVWTLRGTRTDMVLHEGITDKSSEHLLRGKTSVPLGSVKVGEDVHIQLDGRSYKLQRTA